MKPFILIPIILFFFSNIKAQVIEEWSVSGQQGLPGIIRTDNISVFAGGFSGPEYEARYNISRYNANSSIGWNYETSPPLYSPYSGSVNDVIYDNSGNVFVTGFIPVSGTSDYQTVMFNTNGAQVWSATYNGSGTSSDIAKAITKDNNFVYVTGSSVGTQGNNDFLTIKYDLAGTALNVMRYNSPFNGADAANSVAVDPSGNIYVTGSSFRTGKGLDFNTVKYLPNGTFAWSVMHNGTRDSTDVPISIIYNNNYLYVTGSTINTGTNFDITTIKYDLSGNEIWVRKYNGPLNSVEKPAQMKVDTFGNVYVLGSSFVNNYDFVTIKYDSNGNLQWAVTSGDSEIQMASGMDIDNEGNVYITGSSNAHPTAAIIKFGPSGNQKWIVHYGVICDTNSCFKTYSNSIDVDDFKNVYLSGYYLTEDFGIFVPFKAVVKFRQYIKASFSFLIEGLYNHIPNTTVPDFANVYLRSSASPYNTLDSASSYFNTSGIMEAGFAGNTTSGIPCYVVIKHRNSIETWSGNPVTFFLDTLNSYNFTTSNSQAYGDNMKLEGTRWTLYSGDPNQDGVIDNADIVYIFNDASNFVTGYVPTDLDSDYFVDINDMLLAYNNSSSFVSVIRP